MTKAQQEAILEFIAHLVSGNFDKIDKDLATMGFVPPEKINALNDAKLTRAIGVLFEAAAAGGGDRTTERMRRRHHQREHARDVQQEHEEEAAHG